MLLGFKVPAVFIIYCICSRNLYLRHMD